MSFSNITQAHNLQCSNPFLRYKFPTIATSYRNEARGSNRRRGWMGLIGLYWKFNLIHKVLQSNELIVSWYENGVNTIILWVFVGVDILNKEI